MQLSKIKRNVVWPVYIDFKICFCAFLFSTSGLLKMLLNSGFSLGSSIVLSIWILWKARGPHVWTLKILFVLLNTNAIKNFVVPYDAVLIFQNEKELYNFLLGSVFNTTKISFRSAPNVELVYIPICPICLPWKVSAVVIFNLAVVPRTKNKSRSLFARENLYYRARVQYFVRGRIYTCTINRRARWTLFSLHVVLDGPTWF